ncbi:DUF1611 domain-containing protein [Congregibacter litoralis]|uniref:DUF1611 domain-containing protein n=1 Tax=Congregibacter litoralis KT71 TaxID=314285 RepID=A4AD99_9GAMM|nr:DUF1611 domain-containing protein [Congregibacter litoralis]EAQ96023.1 hypothetical protein KT71_12810 [Congregibacter litoralis KT71]
MDNSTTQLRTPYLVFVGDECRTTYAKTGKGVADWRPELCAGQLRLDTAAADLGLADMTVSEAAQAGVGSLIVGTALVGGSIPDNWLATLCEAAAAGMDIVAGLHTRLSSIEQLREAADMGGCRLIDIRIPPPGIPVASGKKRSGKRLLTVGTDCALGKKYTALQLERDMRALGMDADFRASGQTGIMIAGSGIPIDCVVADFISGAAEALSPDNSPDHWDVIEGQGSIFHPGYAAVSHGLLIGSQPDAFVVCHAAGRTHIEGWEAYALPTIGEVIERTVAIGALTNPLIRCVGISVNTLSIPADEREEYLAALSSKYDLPCVDPLVTGTKAILSPFA